MKLVSIGYEADFNFLKNVSLNQLWGGGIDIIKQINDNEKLLIFYTLNSRKNSNQDRDFNLRPPDL